MSEEEIKLLNEMKDNCIKQANYVDAKAMEKYNLLRKIEEGIQEKQDLIKYLEDKIKRIDDMFNGLVPQDFVWQEKMRNSKKLYQEILDKVKGEM